MSVLAQIKRKFRGSRVSTRAATLTGSHSLSEIVPLTLQPLPTMLQSCCWFTYQEALLCVCVRKRGKDRDQEYFERGPCLSIDGQGTELKQMTQITPVMRSFIRTATLPKSQISEHHHVVLLPSEGGCTFNHKGLKPPRGENKEVSSAWLEGIK